MTSDLGLNPVRKLNGAQVLLRYPGLLLLKKYYVLKIASNIRVTVVTLELVGRSAQTVLLLLLWFMTALLAIVSFCFCLEACQFYFCLETCQFY